MRFVVCNLREATNIRCNVPHFFISITNPGDEEARLATNEYTVGVLRLQFDDLDRVPNKEDAISSVLANPVVFDDKMAASILDFVMPNHNKVEVIVVHCGAGQSRSAGVAAALSKILNGNDDEFFSRKAIHNPVLITSRALTPNMLVYRTIIGICLNTSQHKESGNEEE